MQSPPWMTETERAEYVAFVKRWAEIARKASNRRMAQHLAIGAEIASIPPTPP